MNEQIPEWLKQEAERKYPIKKDCPKDIQSNHTLITWAKREAYIAGALSRSGGVWVKASERLPEEIRKQIEKEKFQIFIDTFKGGYPIDEVVNIEIGIVAGAEFGYGLALQQIADKEKERLYWQQRCEAAENLLMHSKIAYGNPEAYNKWQQLKQQQPIKKEEI